MTRITLSLPDDFASALRREARRRHTSVSAVAREALAERLGFTGAKREVPFAALGRSTDGRTARESDEVLVEIIEDAYQDAFGGRRR
ncbi:MAG: ribbon-helix-helix protein, CopG family [Solirubrobacterales bacterium]